VENKINWIGEYHKFRKFIQDKDGNYSGWYQKFIAEQLKFFKEMEKGLKKIRAVCDSDEDFCNRVVIFGYDGKEIVMFDNKLMMAGRQYFVGTGYFWNISAHDELVLSGSYQK
jgi:hypothetical protein